MMDEELQTQAALYAIGALPPEEAEAFRTKLTEIPGLVELVAEYEGAASMLAETASPSAPPAALRERILASVASKPEVIKSHRIVWLPWALAAGLAFAAGALWVENQRLTIENTGHRTAWVELNQQLSKVSESSTEKARFADKLSQELAAINKASAEKDALAETLRKQIAALEKRSSIAETQVATLSSKLDGSYLASIAWDNSSQEGVLHVRRLPAVANGKDYQLWVIDPKSAAPVSAGVFTVQADGSATIRFSPVQKVSAASAFAVTVEKAGGVPKAEGPVVLSN